MNPSQSNYLIGLACGLAVPFIWGAWIVASRFGVTHALTAYDVSALRVGVGSLIVLPVLLTRGLSGLALTRAFIISVGAGAPFALTSFTGMSLAPVAHAGVLTNGAMPIFAALLGVFWLRERPGGQRLVAIGLIIIGGLLIGGDSFTGAPEPLQWLGDILLVAAGAIFALYMTALRKWQPEIIQTIVAVPVVSAVLYLPIWALFLPSGLLRADIFPPWPEIALQAGFQGVVASVIVVMLLTRATRSVGATTLAVFLAGAPALAVVFGIFLLDELPTVLAWAGLAVTTAGMVLAVERRRDNVSDTV
ncbi:MAG: EamA family transporter [Alphaproteobacteria bacterium]|nr:EamA family transporter [Alphaproteobacteria bacterium]